MTGCDHRSTRLYFTQIKHAAAGRGRVACACSLQSRNKRRACSLFFWPSQSLCLGVLELQQHSAEIWDFFFLSLLEIRVLG